MAQYQVNDPEDYIECPYDSTHMIRVKRFPYHLMKCRKNNPTMDMARCPFNARHEVPRVELRYHTSRCPDRAMLEADFVFEQTKHEEEGTYFHGNCSVPAYENDIVMPATEDWGTECDNTEWVMNRQGETHVPVLQKVVTTRPPQSIPLVLQQMKVMPPDGSTNALNMSGLGRGRSLMLGASEKASSDVMSLPNGVASQGVNRGLRENTSLLEALARGRGRGILAVGDSVPGRMRGPAVSGNSSWTPGGHGLTTTQSHPTSLVGREHLAGPRTVNAPPLSLRGGSFYRASPKQVHSPQGVQSPRGVQSSFASPGKGRGVAGYYANGGGAGTSPRFVVPNTNQPNQGMMQSDFNSDNLGSEGYTEDLTDELTEEQLAHKREIRKLQKKLRKIEQLEEKHQEGQMLDKDQIEKMTHKSRVIKQLAMLGVQC